MGGGGIAGWRVHGVGGVFVRGGGVGVVCWVGGGDHAIRHIQSVTL